MSSQPNQQTNPSSDIFFLVSQFQTIPKYFTSSHPQNMQTLRQDLSNKTYSNERKKYIAMAQTYLIQQKCSEAIQYYTMANADWNSLSDGNQISLKWYLQQIRDKKLKNTPLNGLILCSMLLQYKNSCNIVPITNQSEQLKQQIRKQREYHEKFKDQITQQAQKIISSYQRQVNDITTAKNEQIKKLKQKIQRKSRQRYLINTQATGQSNSIPNNDNQSLQQQIKTLREKNKKLSQQIEFIIKEPPIEHYKFLKKQSDKQILMLKQKIKEQNEQIAKIRSQKLSRNTKKSRVSISSNIDSKNIEP